MSAVRYRLFKTALAATQSRRYRRLMDAARSPRETQAALLRRILAANAATTYGSEHGFARLASVDDYRRAVPLNDYEALRPWVERQELTGERCLTQEQPVYYHRTSGTVGAPKNIPVTPSGLRTMKRDQRLSAYVWARQSGVLEGKVLAIGGAAVEGHMAGGTPYGAASGLLYRSQSRFVRSRYVLPAELSDVEDYGARYFAMAAYGLSEDGVTSIATANPSTFLRLLTLINEQPDALLDAVATGRLPDASFRPALEARPERAAYLHTRLWETGRLTYADIWPLLDGIVTWTGGSCGAALGKLTPLLAEGTRVIEWGYSASEFRGTLNVDIDANACLPTLTRVFFEFAERDAWESGTADFLGLHELEEGRDYYVFATTPEGLYRYDINDIVRVTGWVRLTPTLAFVQKGKGVTNITGEKLTEAQVLEAVARGFGVGSTPGFFIMLADEATSSYTLYVEHDAPPPDIAPGLDAILRGLNVEYEGKRSSGRLMPLRVRRLAAGSGDRYREACVSAGQRDAQFKHLHLQYVRECAFDFDGAALKE